MLIVFIFIAGKRAIKKPPEGGFLYSIYNIIKYYRNERFDIAIFET
jgi:hypothetical protein